MSGPTALVPGKSVPSLTLKHIEGRDWLSDSEVGANFSLLVFYRGYHCPKCKEQLLELQEKLADFQARGTSVAAISMDPQDRAEKARDEWGLQRLSIVYGLSEEQARAWGLHMSSSRGKTSMGVEELKIFNEPGLFLLRNDGTLYAS